MVDRSWLSAEEAADLAPHSDLSMHDAFADSNETKKNNDKITNRKLCIRWWTLVNLGASTNKCA